MKLTNDQKINCLQAVINHLSDEWSEEGSTGNDVLLCLNIMVQELLLKEYPNHDNQWPSRKWNKNFTEYIDLSS